MQVSRFTRLVARALVALLGAGLLVSIAPGLASAYPIVRCNVFVSPQTVHAGDTFRVWGNDPTPQVWKVTFNGTTQTFHGTSFSTTLRAPKPSHNEVLTLRVTCNGQNGLFSSAFRIQILAATQNGHGGNLPGTGGPSIWWLILGLLAGISGSILVWRGRRRLV